MDKQNNAQGYIKKSHGKSWFVHLYLYSQEAKRLFSESTNEIILQIIWCEKDHIIAEIIKKSDFEDKD